MFWRVRAAVLLLAVSVCFGVVGFMPQAAAGNSGPVPVGSGLLGEAGALALASESGREVVVSALTDGRTLVVAEPGSGLLRAELSVDVERVPDGEGGWRAPSARLVEGSDGLLRPEAAAVDYAVSGGGDGAFVEVSTAGGGVSWGFPGVLPAPAVDGDTATFGEVFPGVDLVAKAGVEGVESFLVVKDREAGENPLVRGFAFDAEYRGLAPRDGAGGGLSLVDSAGTPVLEVPAASMWDSAGVPAVEREAVVSGGVGASALVDARDGSALAGVELEASGDVLSVTADAGLLDDPGTVFPVVIDPEVKLEQTYGVRVISTKAFVKRGASLSEGKVGYSPSTYEGKYYNSRMFFQFKWPKYTNPATGVSDFVSPAQIVEGRFEYNQTHSVQHSPCKSTSKTYPGVKARLYNTISSTTEWPGPGAHSWSAVTDYLAVGHESYCKTSKVQDWNLTSALRGERGHDSYKARTTVTVGLYSADEGNAYGWREYKTPKLYVSYEPAPPAPADFEVSPSVGIDGVPVTASSAPLLRAKAVLAAGMGCRVTAECAGVRFTVKDGGGRQVFAGEAAGQPGDWVAVAPGPLAPGVYSVEASAVNSDTGLASLAAVFGFRVADVGLSGWSWAGPVKADADLSIRIPDADLKPGRLFCVYDYDAPLGCFEAGAGGLVAVGQLSAGAHAVRVGVQDAQTGLAGDLVSDNPPVRDFAW
jgi:hypothetical protein